MFSHGKYTNAGFQEGSAKYSVYGLLDEEINQLQIQCWVIPIHCKVLSPTHIQLVCQFHNYIIIQRKTKILYYSVYKKVWGYICTDHPSLKSGGMYTPPRDLS